MKTAKEILNHHYSFVDDLDEIEYNDLLSMILFTQQDAYNQALEDACEVTRTRTNDESTSIIVDKESILKLKHDDKARI